MCMRYECNLDHKDLGREAETIQVCSILYLYVVFAQFVLMHTLRPTMSRHTTCCVCPTMSRHTPYHVKTHANALPCQDTQHVVCALPCQDTRQRPTMSRHTTLHALPCQDTQHCTKRGDTSGKQNLHVVIAQPAQGLRWSSRSAKNGCLDRKKGGGGVILGYCTREACADSQVRGPTRVD